MTNAKKFLAIFISMLMILSSVGTIAFAADAVTITETVNVPQGVTYTLPATVSEQAVTWSPATVDTSKVGYKLYTGTLADNTTVTYRVNVGTPDATSTKWSDIYSDDLPRWIINGDKLSSDWLTFDIEGYGGKYSLKMNNEVLVEDKYWAGNLSTSAGISHISPRKNNTHPSIVYFDDLVYSQLVYVTDTLADKSVSATLDENAPSAQTATVALTMSDGTTKNFTVNYEADTATPGIGKTTYGTIDGFDENDKVLVTYTVRGEVDKTINAYIGEQVVLEDGRTADTTTFGKKYYKVENDTNVINYTVNTGEFTSKVKDTMSGHTADTTDASYETIIPKTVDGMSLNLKKGTGTDAHSIKLREIDANKVLMLDEKTASDHATWKISDGFSGTYKVKMKLKADKTGIASNQYGLRLSIYNTTDTEIFRCLLNLNDNSGLSYSLGAYRNDKQSNTYAKTALTTSDNTNYTTGWIDVEIIGKDTGTFDIYVNNVRVATDHQLMTVFDSSTNKDTLVPVSTNRDIGAVGLSQRYSGGVTSYIDDLEIFNYRCFDGNPADTVEVLLGQGESNTATLYLPTSNGSVKEFGNITLSDVNTAIIGNNRLELSIPGFDDKFNINAKVCNYHVSAIGYKVGNEFATAPQNGGSVSTVQIENRGSLSAATALFAWYNSSHKLESVKKINISGIGKNESKTIEVGLELPENVAGGYLKVFVLDSMNNLIPVDVAEVFENNGGAAPTIYTVGDSTMCNYPVKKNGQWPRTGIGMVLGNYFTGATVNNNYASSGEWTESFIEEGWWTGIKNNLKEGDYVIISLGHNDQDTCSEKYSAANCVYKKNLKKMIDEAQASCANVILYSPIRRQHEADATTYPDPFGKVDEKKYEKHSHYADMVALASEEGVPYIDMTAISAQMLAGKTTEEQQKYYVRDLYNSVVTRGETYYTSHANWAENSYFKATIYEPLKADNDAMADTSHYNVFGAKTYARRIADEIKKLDIILSGYVNDTAVESYPALD